MVTYCVPATRNKYSVYKRTYFIIADDRSIRNVCHSDSKGICPWNSVCLGTVLEFRGSIDMHDTEMTVVPCSLGCSLLGNFDRFRYSAPACCADSITTTGRLSSFPLRKALSNPTDIQSRSLISLRETRTHRDFPWTIPPLKHPAHPFRIHHVLSVQR